MKKAIILIIVIIIAIAGITLLSGSKSSKAPSTDNNNASSTSKTDDSTPSTPVSGTTKVSSQTSEYHNAELGFSVKYPTSWERVEGDAGVSLIIPIDKTQVSTVAKLQSDINVSSGKCAFPPVTTIKERSTLVVGGMTMNMISMSSTVQGRGYFNRMYSLQKDTNCYMFIFSSITLDPASKGLIGSNITQAQNNNKAIVNTSDAAFIEMVKTFAFVVGPKGIDETKAPK